MGVLENVLNNTDGVTIFLWVVGIVASINFVITEVKKISDFFGIKLRSNEEKNDIKKLLNDLSVRTDSLCGKIDSLTEGQTQLYDRLDNLEENVTGLASALSITENALVENMYDCIMRKCTKYERMGGIPQNERGAFIRLCQSYTDTGGNHGLSDRFTACLNNLPDLTSKQVDEYYENFLKQS